MMQSRSPNGYILMLALTMLSLIIVLVTGLFNRTSPYLFFNAITIKREKAKQLALSGLEIAMAQLQAKVEEPRDKKTEGDEKGPSPAQQRKAKLFQALLPSLNQWQMYKLTKVVDGIDGIIRVAISCEQGKFNINELFDFTTKKFVGEGKPRGDMRKVMQEVFGRLAPYTNGKNLFSVFEKFLKQRQYKLHDITELLRIKEFQEIFATRQFYEPPLQHNAQSKKGKKPPVYLTDIFTVWSDEDTLGVWVLSDAVAAIFGFTRAAVTTIKDRAGTVKQVFQDKALSLSSLEQLWPKGPQKLYGKELKAVPRDLQPLLRTSFEPDSFAVISFASVGNISQQIFAIIERREPEGERPTTFAIKRLYWL